MHVEEILQELPGKRALIVGDVCLDRWCRYEPKLALESRETGIPRIAVVRTELTPGAGGTIANNLNALGVGRVSVLSAIGDDGHGWELRRALADRGIGTEDLIEMPGRATFTYTKLMRVEDDIEDRPRVDFINRDRVDDGVEMELARRFERIGPSYDVIFVSDQAETAHGGLVAGRMREALADFGASHPEKVVWVDSRERPEWFRNVILKPNEDEALAACERIYGEADLKRLRRDTGAPLLIVTRGSMGAEVYSEQGSVFVRTHAVADPVDICGAGDSFSAGAGMGLAVVGDAVAAVQFGNLVASITIMKKGTGTASPDEVRAAYERTRD